MRSPFPNSAHPASNSIGPDAQHLLSQKKACNHFLHSNSHFLNIIPKIQDMGLLLDVTNLMFSLMLLMCVHIHEVLLASAAISPRCRTSCGNHVIKFPVSIDAGCGNPQFSMYCTNDSILQMNFNSKTLDVERIDYDNHILLLTDPLMSDCTNLNLNGAGLDLNLANTYFTLAQGSTILLLDCLSFSQEINLLNNQYDCHNPTCFIFFGSCHANALLTTSCCRVTDPRERIDLYPMQCMSYTSIYRPQNPIFNASSWSYGIELQWSLPSDVNDQCDQCQANNGVCGYNSEDTHQQFTCICDSSLSCKGCISGSCAGSRRTKLVVGLSVAGVLVALVGIVCLFLRKRQKFKKIRSEFTTDSINYVGGDGKYTGMELVHALATMTGPLPLTIFSYKELVHATASFSDTQLIGDGGFGTVYKAKFCDGRVLAVKRLNHQHHRRLQQFYNEVRILSQLRHPHLVQLEGFCLQGNDLMLVYEYVSNGTLEEHLHGEDRNQTDKLQWETRLDIACDVAEALAYLHFSISPPIYHRDVKSGNILLDGKMKAKVADFGLSRLVPMDVTHVSTGPQGTPGYVDPEYHQCYQVTDKSDVYSFGVVLLEMISGKRAVDLKRARHEINLSAFAIARIQGNALNELLDAGLLSARHSQTAHQVANLAFSCIALERQARPNMKEVAAQLHLIRSSITPVKNV